MLVELELLEELVLNEKLNDSDELLLELVELLEVSGVNVREVDEENDWGSENCVDEELELLLLERHSRKHCTTSSYGFGQNPFGSQNTPPTQHTPC